MRGIGSLLSLMILVALTLSLFGCQEPSNQRSGETSERDRLLQEITTLGDQLTSQYSRYREGQLSSENSRTLVRQMELYMDKIKRTLELDRAQAFLTDEDRRFLIDEFGLVAEARQELMQELSNQRQRPLPKGQVST